MQMGTLLAQSGIGLVYGGGSIGMMGVLADAALRAKGEVIGVIPKKLVDLEQGHAGLTEMHVVKDMHERKAKMADLCDGFIALPGGFGTLEELAEAITWAALNYHLKPVGLLNVSGYYDQLLGFIEHAINQGFVRPAHSGLLTSDVNASDLLDRMRNAHIPTLDEWI